MVYFFLKKEKKKSMPAEHTSHRAGMPHGLNEDSEERTT